ncbi:hypothetical protein EVAR_92444_1 [Eumeta japonica]|uniref:Uncharacterized protein n=1 Tax=Eumeta variegata TaxID=151549 RepID=A0A4C1T8M7_EUMVA|nr:hypothetical protein EVAR_92444_1 [Eumeta japonica]
MSGIGIESGMESRIENGAWITIEGGTGTEIENGTRGENECGIKSVTGTGIENDTVEIESGIKIGIKYVTGTGMGCSAHCYQNLKPDRDQKSDRNLLRSNPESESTARLR